MKDAGSISRKIYSIDKKLNKLQNTRTPSIIYESYSEWKMRKLWEKRAVLISQLTNNSRER